MRPIVFRCIVMVFCALLWLSVHCYASLCLSMLPRAFLRIFQRIFAPLRSLMPFVHHYVTLCLSVRPDVFLWIIIRPSAFLCILVQSHTSYVLLRILVILAHHGAYFAFPTILVRCYAFLCILMSFCAPSTFFWPSLCILMPFSVSFRFSYSLCPSFCVL
jgi:hypothetical protein